MRGELWPQHRLVLEIWWDRVLPLARSIRDNIGFGRLPLKWADAARPTVQYDLLAIDLDGTLLDAEHELPADNRAALHRAHDAGLRIVLCTGRSFTETRLVLDQIGLDLDATVTVFGALVSDAATGRTLHRTPIPLDLARTVTAWFQRDGYAVCWLTDPQEVGHDGYLLAGPKRHENVDRWLARTPCDVREVEDLPAGCAAPLRLSIVDDGPVLEHISPRLRAAFDGRLTHNVLHVPPYRLSLIEAFDASVNKWAAIELLCRRWTIDLARTAAIGDDVNDLAMIRNAALGVAMGNANPLLKDVADRVVVTNTECGVARLIDELLST